MSIQFNSKKVVFVNPYDLKGGASLGTFRLFSYFRKHISSNSRLQVIVKFSSGNEGEGISGLSCLLRNVFYLQAALNKFICWLSSRDQLPVAFTFFVPFSLPALVLFFRAKSASSLYLHSMSSGFSCPLSFYLLLSSASVVKTADDWYLTGGCHYSLECNRWQSGCKSCPHMNLFGKLIVRFNWWFKRKVLRFSSDFVFISPSNWLSSRYKVLNPGRCFVVHNSSSAALFNHVNGHSFSTKPFYSRGTGNLTSDYKNTVTLGFPVTYLRDVRKGFYDALPVIISILECYPVRLVLCGGDANNYFDMIVSKTSKFHPGAGIESLGALRPQDMGLFYSKLDFLMHFARFDNSPNVVTESLCFGVPVIVLDDAGSPEHVRASGAGFVLAKIEDLIAVVFTICGGSVDIKAVKSLAVLYSKKVLSSEVMAAAYARFLA